MSTYQNMFAEKLAQQANASHITAPVVIKNQPTMTYLIRGSD